MNLTLLGIVGGLLVLVFLLLSMPVGFSLALVGTAGFALVIHNPEGASHLLKIASLIREYNQNENQVPLREPDLLMVVTGGKMAYTRPDGVRVIPLACLRP